MGADGWAYGAVVVSNYLHSRAMSGRTPKASLVLTFPSAEISLDKPQATFVRYYKINASAIFGGMAHIGISELRLVYASPGLVSFIMHKTQAHLASCRHR